MPEPGTAANTITLKKSTLVTLASIALTLQGAAISVIWTGASELTNVKTRLATVEAQTEKMTSAVNTLRENLQYIRGELAGVRRTLQEER
jgi:hypothetical protein